MKSLFRSFSANQNPAKFLYRGGFVNWERAESSELQNTPEWAKKQLANETQDNLCDLNKEYYTREEVITLLKTPGAQNNWSKNTNTPAESARYTVALQAGLNMIIGNYNVGKVDAIFGNKTKEVVMRFQKDYGAFPDGAPGPITIGKILGVLEKQKTPMENMPKNLRPHTSSDFVSGGEKSSSTESFKRRGELMDGISGPGKSVSFGKEKKSDLLSPVELQKSLNLLGYNVGGADGIIGPKTKSAIQLFQFNNGIPASGIANKKTMEAIKVLLKDEKIMKTDNSFLEKSSKASNENSAKNEKLIISSVYLDIKNNLLPKIKDEHLRNDISVKMNNLLANNPSHNQEWNDLQNRALSFVNSYEEEEDEVRKNTSNDREAVDKEIKKNYFEEKYNNFINRIPDSEREVWEKGYETFKNETPEDKDKYINLLEKEANKHVKSLKKDPVKKEAELLIESLPKDKKDDMKSQLEEIDSFSDEKLDQMGETKESLMNDFVNTLSADNEENITHNNLEYSHEPLEKTILPALQNIKFAGNKKDQDMTKRYLGDMIRDKCKTENIPIPSKDELESLMKSKNFAGKNNKINYYRNGSKTDEGHLLDAYFYSEYVSLKLSEKRKLEQDEKNI